MGLFGNKEDKIVKKAEKQKAKELQKEQLEFFKKNNDLEISGVYFNDEKSQLLIKSSFTNLTPQQVINYKDIASVKETIDGESKKKGVGRAIVGGAIAGPVGSLVGASTGANYSKIKKIFITIYLKDNSTATIHILDSETKSGSITYKFSMKELNEILAKFDRIINSNVAFNNSDSNASSSADEIRKYKSLLDEGILTQEEFDTKKRELLGI